jgi:uncharacterized sulfatase
VPERPSIIFFFTDQQRWDTCGCYGQKLDVTPNLDRMAREGVLFEHAYTCQPVCGPARAVLQTGRYATEVGCFRNGIALPTDERTIAHVMSDAGYEVAYIGKWHLASTHGMGDADANFRTLPVPPERRGGWKDHWIAADVLEFTSHGPEGGYMFDGEGNKREFPGYRVDGHTEFVLDYLRNRKSDGPFFLFISYIEPHHQNDRHTYEGPEGSKERFAGYEVPGDLVGTEGDWRENFPDYLGCCWALDGALGRVREELGRQGILDDTVVLYTSDHGSHFCTRNKEYKRSCHDGCLRIPMVACGPGFTGGKVVPELVSLIDAPPTMLAAGVVEPPRAMRVRPLQGLVDGTADGTWRDAVFAQISESHVGRCIRTKKWKYSVGAPDKEGGKHPASDRYIEQFLYDLEADPHERTNLMADPALAGVRAELAEKLKSAMVEAGEEAPVIDPAG